MIRLLRTGTVDKKAGKASSHSLPLRLPYLPLSEKGRTKWVRVESRGGTNKNEANFEPSFGARGKISTLVKVSPVLVFPLSFRTNTVARVI